MSDDYIKRKTLEYTARFTQIAEPLLRTGRITLVERAELAQCRVMVGLADAMKCAPIDSIPEDYLARVDAALARCDMDEVEPQKEQVSRWN